MVLFSVLLGKGLFELSVSDNLVDVLSVVSGFNPLEAKKLLIMSEMVT